MDEAEARRRFSAARVARLATVRPDGSPHLVPVVFAALGDTVWFAVDDKPKVSRDLQRLANIRGEPRVSLLVDAFHEDWGRLWWVRADGRAHVTDDAGEIARAAELLGAKYPEHARRPPPGPAVAVAVARWRWWSAS